MREIVEAAGLDHAGGVTLFKRHAIALTLLSFDRSDAGDHALLRTQRRIKTALDPLGVIAPGKQGV